jgi:branched-chain amino acid transport system ATP-binding protein
MMTLKTEDLEKNFEGLRAVNCVSIEVPKKSIVLIIGPNGSGKTTLVNCISGFHKVDGGSVYHEGEDITGQPPHAISKKGLSRTFQIPEPFQSLSVLENLLVTNKDNAGENPFWSLLPRKWKQNENQAVDNAFKTLKFLNMDHKWDALASDLSGGQLKLLELGRALMLDVKTILLDEPVGSVNPVLAHEIFSHIQNIRDSLGVTFLIIEHRLDIAMQYVDFVYAMASGAIIAQGTPDQVLSNSEVIESYLGA